LFHRDQTSKYELVGEAQLTFEISQFFHETPGLYLVARGAISEEAGQSLYPLEGHEGLEVADPLQKGRDPWEN
jgi:hypothetical protein